MNSKINILFEVLEEKSPSIQLLEDRIKSAIISSEDLSDFIHEINTEMYQTKDLHNNRMPFYWFYLAIIHYMRNERSKSKEALSNSITEFRTQGLNLNQAIGELLFGIIHYKSSKIERAQRACRAASEILESIIKNCELERSYQRAEIYKKYLRKINALKRLIKRQFPPIYEEFSKKVHLPRNQDYLLLQWLPIYNSVRAGKQGIVWGDVSAHNGTTIYKVELDGKLYEVFSIHSSNKVRGRQITLSSKNNYCWAKVKGHSMNACEPVQLNNNDFVLCSTSWSKNQDAIVIAGFINDNQETSMMVKKYVSKENLLVSETVDTSEDYSPIQITKEYKILGTVIAVAKPTQ